MKIASTIVLSITLLGYTLTSAHAYIGKSILDFEKEITAGIKNFDETFTDGVRVKEMTWCGNPDSDFKKGMQLLALGEGLWKIKFFAYYEILKNRYIIYNVSFTKLLAQQGQSETITDRQRAIINHHTWAADNKLEFTNLKNMVVPQNQAIRLTVTSKLLPALLDKKKKQFQQFKENYLCIGQTIPQLETRFGKGKKVINPAHPHIERHFEKFDEILKENWKIEVVLWKNLGDKEPVVHQVYYKRKTPFTSQELEWQRYINAGGKRWKDNGMDAHFTKFKTSCGVLLAGVRVLQQEAVIITKAIESALPFRAFIGENFDVLKDRIRTRHNKEFGATSLPENPIENFLFLKKYFVKNIEAHQEAGVHWNIEVLVWQEDNRVYEIKYSKVGKHLSEDDIKQIKNMNNRQLFKEPILMSPNYIRPEKLTVTSKLLPALLDKKKKQFQQFKENYLCIGQTIPQLETRFGKGKKVINPAHPHIERHFEKFDEILKENWKIEVVLWKNLGDKEPVVHQVYYKRKTPFTSQELEWQRYINAGGKRWKDNGMDAHFTKFKTSCGVLLAGVRVLQQEAVLHTKAYSTQMYDN